MYAQLLTSGEKRDVALKACIDINALGRTQDTALHRAAEGGHVEMIKFLLLQEGVKEKINAVDQYGRTALHLAASCGCAEVVSALLGAGANVNAKTTSCMKDTPLHQAAAFASSGRPGARENAQETIKILLMYGADISSTDRRGEIPAVAVMDDDIGLFIEKAFNEVRSMKGEKIGTINGQDLSLYDFLKTDDKKQLLLYCSDRSIRNNIHKYLDKHSPFPNKRLIYCNDIIGQLHEGIQLHICQTIITNFLKGDYTIQDEVTGDIKVPSLAGIVEYIYPEISQHFTDTDVEKIAEEILTTTKS